MGTHLAGKRVKKNAERPAKHKKKRKRRKTLIGQRPEQGCWWGGAKEKSEQWDRRRNWVSQGDLKTRQKTVRPTKWKGENTETTTERGKATWENSKCKHTPDAKKALEGKE